MLLQGTWQRRKARVNVAYTLGWYQGDFDTAALPNFAYSFLFSRQRTTGDERHRLVVSNILPIPFGFLFSAVDLFIYSSDNRMAFAAATCLLGLAAATTFAMPDGPPMTWLASSSNRLTVFWLGLLVVALPVTFRAGDWLAAEIGAQSSADAVAVLVSMGVLSVGVLMVGVAQRRQGAGALGQRLLVAHHTCGLGSQVVGVHPRGEVHRHHL